jgi:hypothetical protein
MDLIHVRDLTITNTVGATLPPITNLRDIGDAHGLVRLGLEVIHDVGTIEGLADFFERGATGLDEEEIDGDELNDQPAFEEEVEFPAAGGDAERDGVL